MGISNAFSGGVFISAAMIHIVPDAIENFNTAWVRYLFLKLFLTAQQQQYKKNDKPASNSKKTTEVNEGDKASLQEHNNEVKKMNSVSGMKRSTSNFRGKLGKSKGKKVKRTIIVDGQKYIHKSYLQDIDSGSSTGILKLIILGHKLEEGDDKQDDDEEEIFPVVSVAICLSFLLVLFVDRVLFDSHGALDGGHGHGHGNHSHDTAREVKDKLSMLNGNEKTESMNDSSLADLDPVISGVSIHSLSTPYLYTLYRLSLFLIVQQLTYQQEHKEEKIEFINFTALIIVIAMGIHAAFAGIALGLYNSQTEFFSFLIAIVLHKWAEALTIGISIARQKMSIYGTVILLLVFSFSTPVGALIGMIFAGSNGFLSSIMSSLSAGTFIYIACVEIFSEEFSGKGTKLIKFAASVVGVALMTLVAYVEILTGG